MSQGGDPSRGKCISQVGDPSRGECMSQGGDPSRGECMSQSGDPSRGECMSQGGDPSRGESIVSTNMLHLYRAMRTMPLQDVCLSVHPSVHLSVTRRYSLKTAKDIIKLCSPSSSHTRYPSIHPSKYGNIPTATSITGSLNAMGV